MSYPQGSEYEGLTSAIQQAYPIVGTPACPNVVLDDAWNVGYLLDNIFCERRKMSCEEQYLYGKILRADFSAEFNGNRTIHTRAVNKYLYLVKTPLSEYNAVKWKQLSFASASQS